MRDFQLLKILCLIMFIECSQLTKETISVLQFQLEQLVRDMQDDDHGVPVRSITTIFSTIPAAFMGKYCDSFTKSCSSSVFSIIYAFRIFYVIPQPSSFGDSVQCVI